MKNLNYDMVVIGGGPAGLAAALKAKEMGVSVAVIERNTELGGILTQCIHSGFGLQYFKKELTGPEYAQAFINMVERSEIDVYLKTMVISITEDKIITAVNNEDIIKINAGAVVLAMGCRERTRGAIMIPGSRPAGVLNAGQAQRYMNIENLKIGARAVILGSGDIGLIMARRLHLEGIEVVGVHELMPYPNGLYRNIKHCLDDFNIPLHLSTTVTNIIGKDRLEGVVVSKVDERGKPIKGTEEEIKCDTLLLSVGLIPENELSLQAGVKLNNITNGPIVDSDLETSISGIFACGNVLHVHDLVDNVTREAEYAGTKAAEYVKSKLKKVDTVALAHDNSIAYTVPNFIDVKISKPISIFFRVRKPIKKGYIAIKMNDNEKLYVSKTSSFKPNKIEKLVLTSNLADIFTGELKICIEEEN
jgi:NADPH-dependent 2,4-dienoyl-CoA reductase/sulfur reductase-like enzyme